MDRVSLSSVFVGAIVAYGTIVVDGAIVVDGTIVVDGAIVVDERVFGVESRDGDEVVVLLFVEEFFEDGAIVGVVDGVDGVESFDERSRSPQSRETLRDQGSSRGFFAIEGIVEDVAEGVVARRSSKARGVDR